MTTDDVLAILSILTSVGWCFAWIAAITPNKSDDKWVNFALKWINIIGANVGNAKNVEEKK